MGLKRFQIRINNRRVLNGFYSMLGLTEQSGEIMRTVDKIEKIGPDMVRAILVDDIKLTGEQADEILKFIAITGTNEEVLAALKGYCGRDELFDRGYEELSTVIKYLGGFGVAQENFKVDLTIARGTRLLYRHGLRDRFCSTIRRSARSAPAAVTTISPSIIPTASCRAWASPSA